MVTVQFREKGTTNWKDGMPLRRVPAGNSGDRTRPTYDWGNKHSGSIFDLKSGTRNGTADKPVDIIDPGVHCDFDYDAVGVYDTPYIAKIGEKDFRKLKNME
jgi:hypothetical protein